MIAGYRTADTEKLTKRNLPFGVGASNYMGLFHGFKATAALKTKTVVTGAQIFPINLNHHKKVADYRILDNQLSHSHRLSLYFWESKPELLQYADA